MPPAMFALGCMKLRAHECKHGRIAASKWRVQVCADDDVVADRLEPFCERFDLRDASRAKTADAAAVAQSSACVQMCAAEPQPFEAGDLRGYYDAPLPHVRQQERVRSADRNRRKNRIAAVARVHAVAHGWRVAKAQPFA